MTAARRNLLAPRRRTVPCTVAIEASFENLYAHVDLEGAAPRPGDTVLVLDAPVTPTGLPVVYRRFAEVQRAGLLRRLLVRCGEPFRLLGLAEVGFSGRELP